MFLDATELDERVNDIDVCIIGGGAAGLTLADSLISSGFKTIVLEGGGRKKTKAGQDVLKGSIVGTGVHAEPHHYRVRALGGASQIWGGRCLPYDAIDFENRAWLTEPGWPITYDSLVPYYSRASEAAETGAFDYNAQRVLVPGLDSDLLMTTVERFSRPTHFGNRYSDSLRAASNVSVVLGANVTAIKLHPDARTVSHILVKRADSTSVRVTARAYVVATGGLESVRLLLASDDVCRNGIGNEHGWLGRGYMCHLAATFGMVTFNGPSKAIAFDYERDVEGVYLRHRINLTAQAQRDRRILNLAFRMHLPDPADPGHKDSILSAMYLSKRLVQYEYSRKMRDRSAKIGDYLSHVANIARRPVRLANFAHDWIRRRHFAERKLPSVVLHSPGNCYALEFHSEQEPNRLSRLMLSGDKDSFGMPRLAVEWRMTDLDLATVRQSYGLLASELKRTGTGTLVFDDEDLEDVVRRAGAYGGHHIGAARMSADPRHGVVNEQCRLHSVENLYVAGAAVMPTSSQANPTLTLLALAYRLGDHLRTALTQNHPVPVAARGGSAPTIPSKSLA